MNTFADAAAGRGVRSLPDIGRSEVEKVFSKQKTQAVTAVFATTAGLDNAKVVNCMPQQAEQELQRVHIMTVMYS